MLANVIFQYNRNIHPADLENKSLKILRIALPVPLRKHFDYMPAVDSDCSFLQPGLRIRVPFQRRHIVGIFLGLASQTVIHPNKLKRIEAVLDQKPLLSPEIMKLCHWAADYYHYPLGEVLQAALPGWLRQGKSLPLHQPVILSMQKSNATLPPVLNQRQQEIVTRISSALNHFSVMTLDGVTGSGKTEIYLQIIQQILTQNKQALVLVPEISLTPQILEQFRQRFSVPIIALHSRLTERARMLAWLAAQQQEAGIIIGTRSAIFTPLSQLGVIIVDEEHDPSFKQQDSFRYNARDLAIWRGRDMKVPVILGSATLSLETLHRSWEGHYRYFSLPERASGAKLPTFQIVDVRRQYLEEGLSNVLLNEMKLHLQAGNQVLLFLNRRGFSPILLCHSCGWIVECLHCDARLTYHLRPLRLHCHYCEAQRPVPKHCEQCGEKGLSPLGMGTEKLELTLQKHFPDVPTARLDRDSTRRKGKMEEMLNGIHAGAFRILIGTQMIAKGHHFPDVTLVGIIDADYGLFSADFRASERLGQLILQVAGRAGRATKPGQVWIQTHHPDHLLVQLLKEGNYQQFAQSLLQEREAASLPPFSALALFHAEAHCLTVVENFLQQVKVLAGHLNHAVSVRGPISALMSRRAGRYRMQLLLQAHDKKILQQFLRSLLQKVETLASKPRIHWTVDVDPVEMI